MKLLDLYHRETKEKDYILDEAQVQVITLLEEIIQKINTEQASKSFYFFKKSLYPQIKGLYMWGGVGRGKTFIMDMFFDALPTKLKSRLHFSHFMKNIHALLKKYEGVKSIKKVAYEIAQKNQIICFDEFFVEDIADAMILKNIFRELFQQGVILVATSNIHPSKLYANGLQRESFLGAINVLMQKVNVINLDSGTDYRFREKNIYKNYLFPVNDENEKLFYEKFNKIETENEIFKNQEIEVIGRKIPSLLYGKNSICFDYKIICGHGRCNIDYIDICSKYKNIFVYNVESMTGDTTSKDCINEDRARRFIALIDEAYDQGINVIIIAETDFKEIYQGNKLNFEIQRTISRLNDMQNDSFGVEDKCQKYNI